VYPVIFIDAIHVKIRDGQVANRPIYVALAVTCEGRRDILGLWAGDGGEDAKYWLHVLTELKNRGVADVLMVVCDGLTGLPDAITTVWPQTITQTCVVHLLRNSFRYAGRQHWDAIAKALKPVYTAPTEAACSPSPTDHVGDWATESFAANQMNGFVARDRSTTPTRAVRGPARLRPVSCGSQPVGPRSTREWSPGRGLTWGRWRWVRASVAGPRTAQSPDAAGHDLERRAQNVLLTRQNAKTDPVVVRSAQLLPNVRSQLTCLPHHTPNALADTGA
jgi:hypothetical protein